VRQDSETPARRIRSRAAVPARSSSPKCCTTSTGRICRSIARALSTPPRGVDLDVSTLADWVGACAATLAPIVKEIETHVLSAERIHADDTTVPVLAIGKCDVARLWGYMRDDRPLDGGAAPAVLLPYSRDRRAEHPKRHLTSYIGLMQADAYSGYNGLYEGRKPGPIIEVACWAHGRRKFFELAELQKAPIAIGAVRRFDELFARRVVE
jgi:hypothetical protein